MTAHPTAYWRDRAILGFYTHDQPYRGQVAEVVLAQKPASVLEFGCNVGRNLFAIRERDAKVTLKGVDINSQAVTWGRKHWHLDLEAGDQRWLEQQPDDAFDVAFTVSVLDHIPDAGPVIAELARVAKSLVLVEPWTGGEGDVRNFGVKPNSPSWSWDIPARLRALGMSVTARRMPLGETGMAPTYRLYTARRRP